ncbi:MAG: tryptophan--tRNA ligase [Deltaproteobacteria bacterium]|nr:tryptophan--tRNA ligase [Deltaproteobacteria bacterium]
MKRILSGIQPSGAFHIGNYFGMMQKMIQYQDESDLFCFIANDHAMTSLSEGPALARGTFEAAAAFLALGLDPAKATFWVQSDVPEVQELTWVLSSLTPMGLLERCHSYKDKVARGIAANHGLFAYPVLMAADILLFQSDVVPVGKDQKQHLEVARDLAIKFNNAFGDTFVVPEAEIDDEVAVIPGTDGQKMSKSYGNAIYILTDKPTLKKAVMAIVTDATPVEAPKDPDRCNLYAITRLFLGAEERSALRERYQAGGLKYSDVKKELIELIWNTFAPHRERWDHYLANPGEVLRILEEGAEKARAAAAPTLTDVRKRVGLAYR